MIKNLLFLVLLSFPAWAFSQEPVIFNENINPGVYRTFYEFKANRPAEPGILKYDLYSRHANVVDKSGVTLPAGRFIWGYADSSGFYIYVKGISRLVTVGRYSVFEGIEDFGGSREDFILDYETGQVYKATSVNIIKLLENDHDLWLDYKKNGNSELVYQYMDRYNKKHPINYPGITEEELKRNSNKFGQDFGANNLYVEFFGSSVFYGSFNYERRSIHSGNFYLMNRFGLGFGKVNENNNFTAPVCVNGLFQFHRYLAAEIGVGATIVFQYVRHYYSSPSSSSYLTTNYDVLLNGFAGVRYQNKYGFMARAGFVPLYDLVLKESVMTKAFTPWFGISLGYSFRD